MLEEPRELLARAELPLMPLLAPPKPLRFVELGVLRTCWLPTLLLPVPRFELMFPALAPPRLPAPDWPTPPLFARLPALGCCRA